MFYFKIELETKQKQFVPISLISSEEGRQNNKRKLVDLFDSIFNVKISARKRRNKLESFENEFDILRTYIRMSVLAVF